MSKLFSQLITSATTTPYIRQIDNHYQTAMIAENSEELVECQRELLQFQVQSTAANLQMMGNIARRQDVTNELLGEISAEISGIREDVQQLNETTRIGFALIAERLLIQHETLLEIAQVLRRPFETQALELRNQADKWLQNGMRHTGQEQKDDYTDAMRLLLEVTKNPIGNQDCVTWFQIGWLMWKDGAKIVDAEQSFYRAARLSEGSNNLYFTISVRHQAHMQYLQGRHEEASGTIQKILKDSRDPETLFDGARYAAKVGNQTEAIRLLDVCIDINPLTYIDMSIEEDFL